MWPFSTRPKRPALRPNVAIRMEAIGGQGANSAGRILAEAAVLGHQFTGNHFSSFGSEKRGSPVRSFVQFSPAHQAIRSASFSGTPQLIIIFHESMLTRWASSLEGAGPDTDLLVNTPLPPGKLLFPTGLRVRNIYTVDALKIAANSDCRVNSVLLGAATELLPELRPQVVEEAVQRFLGKLTPQASRANHAGFLAGAKAVRGAAFRTDQASAPLEASAQPRLGWLNAPIGGVIANPGNTVLKDHSVSRKGVVPKFLADVCCHCGFCDMVCPDFCFVWEPAPATGEPVLQGIDYQFCKACQKCISICPVEALVPCLEADLPATERTAKLFPGVTQPEMEASWKNRDWNQAMSLLSPEERALTLQSELLNPGTYLRPDFSGVQLPPKEKE